MGMDGNLLVSGGMYNDTVCFGINTTTIANVTTKKGEDCVPQSGFFAIEKQQNFNFAGLLGLGPY